MNYPITVIQSSWRARQSQRPSFYYPPLNLPKQVKYLAREFRAGIKAVALYDMMHSHGTETFASVFS
ncbi:MAG: hypothetical protein DMF30_00800 [Verrucomicrobia bacterium]|nr:MAG: hypothetical protein DMF30_00800 [Verrucomicrobiota bacterium]